LIESFASRDLTQRIAQHGLTCVRHSIKTNHKIGIEAADNDDDAFTRF